MINKCIDDVVIKMDRSVREFQSNWRMQLKQAVAAKENAEFVSAQYHDIFKQSQQLQASVTALQKTVSGQASLPPNEADAQAAIVVSGFPKAAGGTKPDLASAVQEMFSDTRELGSAIKVVSAGRLGASGKPTPRKILVQLETTSKQQASAIIKAAKSLREHDQKAKKESRQAVGIDRNLSGPQLKHRSAIWPEFKSAKAAGKSCR